MAEISLRAYQDKVDSLARASQYEAVIAHCRHMLRSQPSNLRAHLQLGNALAASGQDQPAAQALRRALAASPSHYQTHLLLAQVCQRLGEGERAIWHAERAYDQRPNDPAAADLIRSLYRTQRGQEVERLQLTAAALARQHIRANLLGEAIAALDQALQSQPQRVDLQLLRARALWLDGQRMDAAEAAADILENLPYALDANRILTELWLAEQRPSDAAPYLRRIEALDPYLAQQLATGETAPDNLVMLEELAEGALPTEGAPLDDDESREDSLSDAQIDQLFAELVIGESVAATSDLPPQTPPTDEPADLEDRLAQLDGDDDADSADDELADLLAQLDQDDESGDWMAEIQRGDPAAVDEDLEYVEDGDREWVAPPESDEEAGAPWLSAAMREVIEGSEEGAFDLFGDDQGLQNLLQRAGDTEPLDAAAMEDWLDADDEESSPDSDETALNMDDDLLHSPPSDSWLAVDMDDDDATQRNAELIDSWDSELGEDDEDDDPYVDWLSEDLIGGDDLSSLSAEDDEAATERARAWGLDDPQQLADFVEAQSDDAGGADTLNVALPGLDRADAQPENPDEFASPAAASRDDFAWLSDLVEEETGSMPAVAPDETVDDAGALYFRFSKPPAWLSAMQREESLPGGAFTPHSLDEDIQALQLDDLTFDDYFNFSTPTDKLDAISLDSGDELNFVGLDWDDYFDLESPTEQTIAITLKEDAEPVQFDELGVDDDDFDFAAPGQASAGPNDSIWDEFADGDSADSSRRSGQSAL